MGAGEAGQQPRSALLLPVTAAEPVVSGYRARLDSNAALGIPAHLTVLYPFLSPALIDEAALASLSGLFASASRFSFILDRVGWFGEDVVWLGPRDPAPLRALTDLAFGAFPSCLPYGGQFTEVVPHLTVGHAGGAVAARADTVAALRAAADEVRSRLPITAEATEVILMTGPSPETSPPARWRRLATFPLGTSTAVTAGGCH